MNKEKEVVKKGETAGDTHTRVVPQTVYPSRRCEQKREKRNEGCVHEPNMHESRTQSKFAGPRQAEIQDAYEPDVRESLGFAGPSHASDEETIEETEK